MVVLTLYLGDGSLCRLLGETGEWLRLLLISPFRAAGPLPCLLGPSSSEDDEDDPVSENGHALFFFFIKIFCKTFPKAHHENDSRNRHTGADNERGGEDGVKGHQKIKQ